MKEKWTYSLNKRKTRRIEPKKKLGLFLFAIFSMHIMKGGLSMTYKQIEGSREIRLWIGQIIVPAITVAASTLAIPEVRQAIAAKANDIKRSIKNKQTKVYKF